MLIARANHRVVYPARFQLVAAMNPCRCGQATEPGYACRRQPNERCMAQYQARLSGPLLDRIDLVIDVPAVTAADLILPPPTEGSAEVAARVAAARQRPGRALRRPRPSTASRPTPPARPPLLEEVAQPDREGLTLLRDAADAMRLSARGYHRVLKVARTLADLDGEDRCGASISPRRCPIAPTATASPPRRDARAVVNGFSIARAVSRPSCSPVGYRVPQAVLQRFWAIVTAREVLR